VKCVTFVSDTFTRFGSNVTNMCRKFLHQWLWHSLAKLWTKKL